MSCGSCNSCNCNPCSCDDQCDPANEPLSSALNNFISSFFGTVTKSCVDGAVVWALPCNLDTEAVPGFPRVAGEGLACYLARIMSDINANGSGVFNPLERYVYLVNNTNDQARMGGVAEQVYITIQAAYDAASALATAGGFPVNIMIHTADIGQYGDLSLSADFNQDVRLRGFGSFCPIGTIFTNGFDVPFMVTNGITIDAVDTRNLTTGTSGDFQSFGTMFVIGGINTSTTSGDSGNVYIQEGEVLGLIDTSSTSGFSGQAVCFLGAFYGGVNASSSVSLAAGVFIIEGVLNGNVDLKSPTGSGVFQLVTSSMSSSVIDVSSPTGNSGVVLIDGNGPASLQIGSFLLNAPLGLVGFARLHNCRIIGAAGLSIFDIVSASSNFVETRMLADANQHCIADLDADGITFTNCVFTTSGTGFSIDASVVRTVYTFDLKDNLGFGPNVTSSTPAYHITDPNITLI